MNVLGTVFEFASSSPPTQMCHSDVRKPTCSTTTVSTFNSKRMAMSVICEGYRNVREALHSI
eukprot:12423331-Heterocapsa_arctica.AAC.1